MKKSTVIKFVVALTIVMIIFWMILNYLKNRNNEIEDVQQYNYFVLFQNEKMGVIDKDSNIIIEPNFNNIVIPNPAEDVFFCFNGEETKYLNKNKEELFLSFEQVEFIEVTGLILEVPYNKKVLSYKENGKYGLINYSGNLITEAKYDEISALEYKPEELKVKQNNKYGVIDVEGKELIKQEYDYIEGDKYYKEGTDHTGYIIGKKNDEGYKYGYLDKDKKEVLEIKYNNIERVLGFDSEDIYLIAYLNGKGAIIRNKKEITDYEYTKIEKVQDEKLFLIEKANKYGVLNLEGKSILKPEFEELKVEGVNIFAKKEGMEFIFDYNGSKIDNIVYFRKYKTKNDNYFITINKDGLYGVVNKNNDKIINEQYVYIEYAYGDYFIVSGEDGKTGVIDSKNNIIIDIKYDIIEKLQNGKIIQTVELEGNTLALYNNEIKKIYEGSNTQISINEKYIALVNNGEIKYFDLNGNEINNIREVEENTMPEKIGEYSKVYYSYGQVYYTDLELAE